MVITHDYWVESESDKWYWQLDLIFSPVDMCRYKHTHTHTLRQKYLRVSTVAPAGRLRA